MTDTIRQTTVTGTPDDQFDFTDAEDHDPPFTLSGISLPGPDQEVLETLSKVFWDRNVTPPADLDCVILEHDHSTFLTISGNMCRVPLSLRLACSIVGAELGREVWLDRADLDMVVSKMLKLDTGANNV
jgi:hypothetical protein